MPAKIVAWPAISNAAYRSVISELRVSLIWYLNWLSRNAKGGLADFNATLRTAMNDADAGNGNHIIYKSGTAITGVIPSGVYTTSVTITVNSAGAITAIVLA